MNHTPVHYVIGLGALALAAATFWHADHREGQLSDKIGQVIATSHQGVALPAPRNAWAALSPDAVVALSDKLKSLMDAQPVNIWCPDLSCQALAADIDDAFQILGWPSDLQSERIDSNNDTGLFVGPGGKDAANLAAALSATVGAPVQLVDMPPGSPLSVVIGRRPKTGG